MVYVYALVSWTAVSVQVVLLYLSAAMPRCVRQTGDERSCSYEGSSHVQLAQLWLLLLEQQWYQQRLQFWDLFAQ